jgi:hypothetical protein
MYIKLPFFCFLSGLFLSLWLGFILGGNVALYFPSNYMINNNSDDVLLRLNYGM